MGLVYFVMMEKFYKIIILPYAFALLYMMFFAFGREQYSEHIVRLMPIVSTFEFVKNSYSLKSIIINILGNIIMFMPFGALSWLNPKWANFKTLVIHFLSVMVVIEAVQYFARRGVFDVDDLLLNTFGLWLGFLLHRKWTKINTDFPLFSSEK
ncbi:MAG: VanZ family protein [Bergeyella zoohelcum]|nr:VanZ family protein [Bergeyella zoohelcum]